MWFKKKNTPSNLPIYPLPRPCTLPALPVCTGTNCLYPPLTFANIIFYLYWNEIKFLWWYSPHLPWFPMTICILRTLWSCYVNFICVLRTFIADHKMSNASIIMLDDELFFHSIYHHNANCEKYIIFPLFLCRFKPWQLICQILKY